MTPVAAAITWDVLLPLILKHGLPWALDLLDVILEHPTPTADVIPELRRLAAKSMDDYLREARERLGLPPASPTP